MSTDKGYDEEALEYANKVSTEGNVCDGEKWSTAYTSFIAGRQSSITRKEAESIWDAAAAHTHEWIQAAQNSENPDYVDAPDKESYMDIFYPSQPIERESKDFYCGRNEGHGYTRCSVQCAYCIAVPVPLDLHRENDELRAKIISLEAIQYGIEEGSQQWQSKCAELEQNIESRESKDSGEEKKLFQSEDLTKEAWDEWQKFCVGMSESRVPNPHSFSDGYKVCFTKYQSQPSVEAAAANETIELYECLKVMLEWSDYIKDRFGKDVLPVSIRQCKAALDQYRKSKNNY